MKKVLVILLSIISYQSIAQTHNVSKVYVKDSIISRTNNTDLFLYGRGTGNVSIEGRYTLPTSYGANGTVITSDGTGATNFSSITGSGVLFGAASEVPYMNSGGTNFIYSSGFTYDGNNLHVDAITDNIGLYVQSSDAGFAAVYLGDDSTPTWGGMYTFGTPNNLYFRANNAGVAFIDENGDWNYEDNEHKGLSAISSNSTDLDISATGQTITINSDELEINTDSFNWLNGAMTITGSNASSPPLLIEGNTDDIGSVNPFLIIRDNDNTPSSGFPSIDFHDYTGLLDRIYSSNQTGAIRGMHFLIGTGSTNYDQANLSLIEGEGVRIGTGDLAFRASIAPHNYQGTIVLPTSPTGTTTGALRYNTGNFQVYDGGWNTVGGGAGSVLIDGTPVASDYARWISGTTIQGRSYSEVRSDLSLEIGIDVQSYDADLTTIGGLSKADGNFIVANGSNWITESGATARTSLGLGTMSTQNASGIALTGNMTGTTGSFTGNLTALDFVLASDISLKENVSKIGGGEIDYITYNYIGHDRKRFGVSAQQVKEILPEAVTEVNGKLAVSYIDLLIYQIAKLEERIKELENE